MQATEIQSVNPATGRLLRSHAALTADAVDTRIAAAYQSFHHYKETGLPQRVLWVKKLAGILDHEMEELATLLTQATGKPITASRQEILTCAACCRFYAEHAARLLAPESLLVDTNACDIRFDPLGVILAVTTPSSPFWQVFRSLVPALIAGNVVLLHPASSVPQCALEIETLIRRAGFPAASLQALVVQTWQVESVLSDPRVAAVTISGSGAANRSLAAQAGWLAKKSILQTGGSDAFIVMPSSNLFAAIQAGVHSRCMDNGQSSLCATRFLVHESIYEDFELLFTAAMEEINVGNPMKDETELGPLASEQVLKTLEGQIATAVRAGGRVLTGGQRLMGQGNFFEPTVLVEVPPRAKVCREELLGPVALLFKVASLTEAIAFANDSPLGTGASVWTLEKDEQEEAASGLVCGSVFLNMAVTSHPELPSGGVKGSGYGREPSSAGLREFVSAKTIVSCNLQQEPEMMFDLSSEYLLSDDPQPISPQVDLQEVHQAEQPGFTSTEAMPLDFKQLLEQSMRVADTFSDDTGVERFASKQASEPFRSEDTPTPTQSVVDIPSELKEEPFDDQLPSTQAIAFPLQRSLTRVTKLYSDGRRLIREKSHALSEVPENLKKILHPQPQEASSSAKRPLTPLTAERAARSLQPSRQTFGHADSANDEHLVMGSGMTEEQEITPGKEPDHTDEELVPAGPYASFDLKQMFERSLQTKG